jgi:hypothetical protein
MSTLYFDSVRQDRGDYFIKYTPPGPAIPFAMLHLTFPGDATLERVARAMEHEATEWTRRYPVATAVSSTDRNGNSFELKQIRPFDWLAACPEKTGQGVRLAWRFLDASEYVDPRGTEGRLREVYFDIPCRTKEQVREHATRNAKNLRRGVFLLALWVAGVPAIIALLEYKIEWLGILALLYTLFKAAVTFAKVMGYWKPSARARARQAESLRKDHHHYHCERNPEGFLRLKIENFEREERDRIQVEAAGLKAAAVT